MDFKLPDIGEGVHEGEVTKWLVKPGDKLAADQPMVEVMTDKATVEIPSPVAGIVEEVFAEEGQTIEVGKVLLRIAENGKTKIEASERVAAPPEREVKETRDTSPTKPASPTSVDERDSDVLPFNILATPATRKLARDLEIDLKNIKGTGTVGRVTKDDVRLAYEGHQAAQVRTSHPAPTQVTSLAPAAKPTAKLTPIVQKGALQVIPLKGVRKKIAEAMAHSKNTAAHFTYVEEVDMTEVVKLRASVKDEAEKRGVKLTFLPFIIKAVIPALKEFPFLNSSLDDERQEIVLKGDYNIGIATDTPNGLIVPVIKNADAKSIWELASSYPEVPFTCPARNNPEMCRASKLSVSWRGSIQSYSTA